MVVFDAYVQQCAERHALVLGTRASAKQMEQAVMSLTSWVTMLFWLGKSPGLVLWTPRM